MTRTLRACASVAASAQVDALAAAPRSLDGAQLLAVAQSRLEGNEWGGIVALVDAADGARRSAFTLASGVAALAWGGTDGDLLALACDNGDVQLLRAARLEGELALVPLATGDEEGAGGGHDDVVTSVSASPLERNTLATGSWDLSVKLWDVTSMGSALATLEGHTDLVWSVAMNRTAAHLLASASQDCTVQLWDARQPTDAVQAIATRFPALVVDWQPQGETVLSAGLEDGSVLTFDTRSCNSPLLEANAHAGPVHALQYSHFHADLLASGGDDASVFLRDGAQAPQRVAGETGSSAHSDYVRALAWLDAPASGPAPPLLATGSWDQTLRTWALDE
ncbi:hypothetical protein PybrP1_006103 [[Pythium] brassicae (nom. inval.)]|nr:hypothetical protein PybrP1_006103 [[Pythium] brassicae (nom. inval.)]